MTSLMTGQIGSENTIDGCWIRPSVHMISFKLNLQSSELKIEKEDHKIKTPFYGKIAILRTERNAPLRLWMSPNFPQFRYDGEIQRAEEEMVMISDCNRNPRMDSVMKSMREAFSSSESKKEE